LNILTVTADFVGYDFYVLTTVNVEAVCVLLLGPATLDNGNLDLA
jgi:hypothetical protein